MKKSALHHLLVTFGALALLSFPVGVFAAPGDLYAADRSGGTIFRITPDGVKSTFASGLSQPIGLAFDGSGNLFVAEFGAGTIVKFTPNGARTTFASGLSQPVGLAFDRSGNLYEADNLSGTIFKFAPDGTQSSFAAGLSNPFFLAFDSSGNLFESDRGSGTIFKFTPDGTKSTFATGLSNGGGGGLAFDSSGNLFEADKGSSAIFKFTPAGIKSIFAAVSFPYALAFDQSGNLFDAEDISGTILKFTPTGTQSTFVSGLNQPEGLAFEPAPHQLINISTRGFVGTGDSVLIGGFIITGNGVVNGKVLVRALGPSLTAAGVNGALQDPIIRLFDSSGAVIATNDNWKDTQQALIQATGHAPTDDREAAIYASVPAGAYTAIVTGANNTTGIALVDVFNLQ
jgi:sugar lactone lactonase YvrE